MSPGSLPDFSQMITVDNQIVSCIAPSVAQDGGVNFIPTFVPKTGTGGTRPTGIGVLGGTKIGGRLLKEQARPGTKPEARSRQNCK
ncbi:MAG TPA: hypothetical protein VFM05_11035, partial [Candidatus Saccharimonadales bacterium]|nr:hypothetical protein [Candidatus Saccharimonadales bacterium]